MSLLDTLRKNLSPEVLTAVQDALGDDFDFDMVPRSRLNTVIKQRNDARKQVKQLQGDDDDDSVEEGDNGAKPQGKNSKGRSYTQEDLDKAVQAERTAGAGKIAEMQKRYATTAKLREAAFVDPDLVINAGLIDMSKIVLDANGVVTEGLDDQISSLAESKPYLKGKTNGAQHGTGKKGGSGDFGAITSKEEFLKLPADKQIEFKKSNPDMFKSFLNS